MDFAKYILLFISLYSNILMANTYEISPTPSWTESHRLVLAQKNKSQIAYKLHEKQIKHDDEFTVFTRQLIHINSYDVLSTTTHVNIDYFPSYQTVQLHNINVIKNTGINSQLSPQQIKVLQIEEDLHNNTYNGMSRINVLIKGLSIGDSVLVEYSVNGLNTIFANKYFDQLPIQMQVGVEEIHYRFLYSPDNKMNFKVHGSVASAQENKISQRETNWVIKRPAPVVVENNMPASFIPAAWLQVSEYNSWEEVRDWANKLFYNAEDLLISEPVDVSRRIKQWLNSIPHLQDKSNSYNKTIYAVRNDIRYTMTAVGPYSHLAHEPDDIIKKGYGDCKDKVNLILASLNSKYRTQAYPVLVNSRYGEQIDQWLPSPGAFDHAIILLQLYNGEMTWIDPTSPQKLYNIHDELMPDFGNALVLQSGYKQLQKMHSHKLNKADYSVVEHIDLSEKIADTVTLESELTFHSYIGEHLKTIYIQKPNEFESAVLETYRHYYPKLALTNPVEVNISDTRFIIQIKAVLTGPPSALWSKENNQLVARFLPLNVMNYLPNRFDINRKMPFAAFGPLEFNQETTVTLPYMVTENVPSLILKNTNFDYSQKSSIYGQQLKIAFHFKRHKDEIMPAEFKQYDEDAKKLSDNFGFHSMISTDLSTIANDGFSAKALYQKNLQAQSSTFNVNWLLVIVSFMSFLLLVIFALKIYKTRNNVQLNFTPDPYLQGFEGGLFYMVGFCLLSFIFILLSMFTVIPFFSLDIWNQLTTQSSELFHPLWSAYIPFKAISEISLVVFLFMLLLIFFQKKYLAKKLFIGIQSVKIIFILTNFYLIETIANNIKNPNDMPSFLVQSSQWVSFQVAFFALTIGYFLFSKQVKHTFVN